MFHVVECSCKQQTQMLPLTGNDFPMRLRSLLKWLIKLVDPEAQSLFWCILFSMSFAIDTSSEVCQSSDNLLDMPVLVGPKGRVKTLDSAQKTTIAKIASKGEVYKSGQSVVTGMELLGKHWYGSAKTANKWIEPLGFQYSHRTQEIFRCTTIEVPIYSLAWDATRLSSYDALATTMYNPGVELAVWARPQALSDTSMHVHQVAVACLFYFARSNEC